MRELRTSPVPWSSACVCNRWRCRAQIITKYTVPSFSSGRPTGGECSAPRDRAYTLRAATAAADDQPRRPSSSFPFTLRAPPLHQPPDRPFPSRPTRVHYATVAYYSRSTTLYTYLRTRCTYVHVYTERCRRERDGFSKFTISDRRPYCHKSWFSLRDSGRAGGREEGHSRQSIDFVCCDRQRAIFSSGNLRASDDMDEKTFFLNLRNKNASAVDETDRNLFKRDMRCVNDPLGTAVQRFGGRQPRGPLRTVERSILRTIKCFSQRL